MLQPQEQVWRQKGQLKPTGPHRCPQNGVQALGVQGAVRATNRSAAGGEVEVIALLLGEDDRGAEMGVWDRDLSMSMRVEFSLRTGVMHHSLNRCPTGEDTGITKEKEGSKSANVQIFNAAHSSTSPSPRIRQAINAQFHDSSRLGRPESSPSRSSSRQRRHEAQSRAVISVSTLALGPGERRYRNVL